MTWKSGQSGNPKGRAIEKPFRDALIMQLKEAGPDSKALRAIAANVIALAAKDDSTGLAAAKEIADRLDGKVPQSLPEGTEGIKGLFIGWMTDSSE
jgi:hypothetical protein